MNIATNFIPLFDLNYDQAEIDALREVLLSKWITSGPKVNELEKKFEEFLPGMTAVALSNCTVALHLAVRLSGVGPGDEVIVPSLTFVATVNAVLMQGATPVFADVTSLNDWTISVDEISELISPRTKAVIAMHYAGYGADMARLRDICSSRGIKLIEDACHAPLAMRGDLPLGAIGDFSCYSFYGNKTIAVGEGGLLATRCPNDASTAKLLRSHGMTTTSHQRFNGGPFYDVLQFGFNYRLDDIHAALAIVQLSKLKVEIKRRSDIVLRYRKNLAGNDAISIPFEGYEGISGHYIFPVFVRGIDRDSLASQLRAQYGIQVSFHYPPAHLFSCYKTWTRSLAVTETIASGALTLPLYSALTNDQVDRVSEGLINLLK
jgi:dTDP-4-amino-4,6-dideoxygalactose transaminase